MRQVPLKQVVVDHEDPAHAMPETEPQGLPTLAPLVSRLAAMRTVSFHPPSQDFAIDEQMYLLGAEPLTTEHAVETCFPVEVNSSAMASGAGDLKVFGLEHRTRPQARLSAWLQILC